MTPDVISPDLKATLRRLKLSRMLDTLPDRLTLARQQKMPHQDLLLLDDFAIDVLDGTESRDLYEILLERYRTGSIIVTSNRGPDEWLATFADPVRAQSALDRFTSRAFDLVIEGESYRTRLKPSLPAPARRGPAVHG